MDLSPTTDITPTALAVNAATGFKVLDLGGIVKPIGKSMGHKRVSLVMHLPTAPTTYGDTLTMYVEQSDNIAFGYDYIADFPDLYAMMVRLKVMVTTAFVAADIGGALTGGTTTDAGLLRWMHPDAETAGNVAYMMVSQADAGDTYADPDEAVTGGTTGVGYLLEAGYIPGKPYLGGPGTYICSFSTTKRYLRLAPSASGGSNWGKVSVWVNPYDINTM